MKRPRTVMIVAMGAVIVGVFVTAGAAHYYRFRCDLQKQRLTSLEEHLLRTVLLREAPPLNSPETPHEDPGYVPVKTVPQTAARAADEATAELTALRNTTQIQADLIVELCHLLESQPEERRAGALSYLAWADYITGLKGCIPAGPQQTGARLREIADQTRAPLATLEGFLAGLNTTRMTPAQKANHEELLALLQQTRDLIDALNQDPAAADAAVIRGEILANMRVLHDLLEFERDIAFVELARALGCGDEDGRRFADHLKCICDVTSLHSLW